MFKKIFYIPFLSLVLFASCKKKDEVGLHANYTGAPQVDFNNYFDENGQAFVTKTFQFKDTILPLNVEVKLSNTTGTATEDITVEVKKVDALVSDYNTTNGTGYKIIANTDIGFIYDFSKPVIIRKGTRSTIIPIMVNVAKLSGDAIGLVIQRVSGAGSVVGRQSKVVVNVAATNQYHGNYKSNGYFYHPTVPRAITDLDKFGSTAGVNSITMELGDLGAAGYVALFTVNPNNTVTITPAANAAGAPYTMFTAGLPTTNPGYTAAWPGSASCNNTYDPATKTFRVRYGYMGGSGWRVTEEVIVAQ